MTDNFIISNQLTLKEYQELINIFSKIHIKIKIHIIQQEVHC